MSNAIYPSLPGILWPIAKSPIWKTNIQESMSGKEIRTAVMTYPRWQFTLAYEFLRSAAAFKELQQLADFYNARYGAFDDFLFNDESDNTVTAEVFGTGDGTTTDFQLLRRLYTAGFSEPVQNLNAAPSIFINAALRTVTTHYTISSLGAVTFVTPPAAAAVLTWTGTFYYRCRFAKDSMDYEQFMKELWSTKKVELKSIKL